MNLMQIICFLRDNRKKHASVRINFNHLPQPMIHLVIPPHLLIDIRNPMRPLLEIRRPVVIDNIDLKPNLPLLPIPSERRDVR